MRRSFPASLLVLVLARTATGADPATAVYNHACAWCHGKDGRGDGPAAFSIDKYLSPRPRDLTRGRFELRSTASGELPTDEDLLRTLEHGIPGYMPSFRGLTADASADRGALWDLVASTGSLARSAHRPRGAR